MTIETSAGADLLATIVAATRRIVEARAERLPLDAVARQADRRPPRKERFRDALARRDRLNVIAECKRRSPSRGVLRAAYDPAAIASGYQAAGAAAISVLTEPTFFDGSVEHLTAVRAAVDVPLLRKDFIVSEYQLFEARAAGADAVLLIAAALQPPELGQLLGRAEALGLDALVEVHTLDELMGAVDAGAGIVGVNNRNLRTLEVDLHASETLIDRTPAGVLAVSESGLRDAPDIDRLYVRGYRGFLIGERLMTAADPGGALRELLAGCVTARRLAPPGSARPPFLIKVCGITRLEDARAAIDCGALAIGFVFWPRSPRFIAPERARAIADRLPGFVSRVGVFVNQTADEVNAIGELVGLDAVQLHGDETVEYAAHITRPVAKAIALTAATDEDIERWDLSTVLLLDAHDPARRGGTGQTTDWTRAAAIAAKRRIVLAGGLTPDNVADAIERVRPFGIDVSSGVEVAPGVKDPSRIKALVEAAARAEATAR